MAFRQYGGINYASKNNIISNNYTTTDNLTVTNQVGQPDSQINFQSDIYTQGNVCIGVEPANAPNNAALNVNGNIQILPLGPYDYPGNNGIYFADGTFLYSANEITGPTGAQGSQGTPGGDTGPVGPVGPTGAQGNIGPQGLKGNVGDQGSRGDTGAVGAVGPTGAVGVVGPTGFVGPQGPVGGVVTDIWTATTNGITGTGLTGIYYNGGPVNIGATAFNQQQSGVITNNGILNVNGNTNIVASQNPTFTNSAGNTGLYSLNPLVYQPSPTNFNYYMYYNGITGCTGTFSTPVDTVVNYLVGGGGGGGGGGGYYGGGGGGGGGVIYGSFVASANTQYNITVGGGGTRGKYDLNGTVAGNTGGKSSITTNTGFFIEAFGGSPSTIPNLNSLSGGSTASQNVSYIASGATSGNPGGGGQNGKYSGGGGGYYNTNGNTGIPGGSAFPLNNVGLLFNDGLISGLYFGGGGGGGGEYGSAVGTYGGNGGNGGNGGVGTVPLQSGGGSVPGGGGGGGGGYVGAPFGNSLFNFTTSGGNSTSTMGGTGGNGAISGGGGGCGGGAAVGIQYGGDGGGGIVMLYFPSANALTVTGNASVTGTLSIGGGLQPRYTSGWFPVTVNTTYNSGTSSIPPINFSFTYDNVPMFKVLFSPTFPLSNNINYNSYFIATNGGVIDITNQGTNNYYTYTLNDSFGVYSLSGASVNGGAFSILFNASTNIFYLYTSSNVAYLGYSTSFTYNTGYYNIYLY